MNAKDRNDLPLNLKSVDPEDNCFDWIRIFVAFIVFFGHFLTHFQVKSSVLTEIAYFIRGVPVFFCLSGFFVARSVERYRPKEFFVRRFVRIYPAMWTCIFVNTVLILTLYAVHPTARELLIYLGTQLTAFQFYTGSWLRGYGVGVPNGALWTITVDIQFYLLVYLLVKWLKNRPLHNWIEIIFGGGVLSLLIKMNEGMLPELVNKLFEVCILPFLYIFLFGMMVYFFRDRFLPVFCRFRWLFIAIYVVWSLLPGNITGVFEGVRYNIVTTLLLMCAVFSVGYGFGKHRLKTDYSYAFYLWHMVVINFFYHRFFQSFGTAPEMAGWMAVQLAITGALAWLSVQLVDKRLCRKLQSALLQRFSIAPEPKRQ